MSIAGLNTLPSVRANNILVGQYANSPNLKAYIGAIMAEFDLLHANSIKALTERTLDTATGYSLEVLGEIVGQPRGTKLEVDGLFFGFDGSIASGTFGSNGNPTTGEVFRSDGVSVYKTLTWSDEEYRKFIKARIIKNTEGITINTIIKIILMLIDGISDVVITTVSPLVFNIHIPQAVGDNDKLLLLTNELIPVPVGCSYTITDVNGLININ